MHLRCMSPVPGLPDVLLHANKLLRQHFSRAASWGLCARGRSTATWTRTAMRSRWTMTGAWMRSMFDLGGPAALRLFYMHLTLPGPAFPAHLLP